MARAATRPTPATSPKRAALLAWATRHDLDLIFFDPPQHFDHAILGVVFGYGQEPAVLYDEAKVLGAMIADGMTEEAAEEWFEYHTIGAYLGEATPRFLITPDDVHG
jgi:hypothetical protein